MSESASVRSRVEANRANTALWMPTGANHHVADCRFGLGRLPVSGSMSGCTRRGRSAASPRLSRVELRWFLPPRYDERQLSSARRHDCRRLGFATPSVTIGATSVANIIPGSNRAIGPRPQKLT